MAPRSSADSRLLLLYGEESFLVEEEARRVLVGWRAELVSDFGYEILDPSGLNGTRLRDAVRQTLSWTRSEWWRRERCRRAGPKGSPPA